MRRALALKSRSRSLGRAAERDRLGRGHPGRERGRQRADRPVAAPDDAIPAEACDRVLDIGADVVEGPGRAVGIGDDAGDLDRDIRPVRDFGDPLAPGMLGALLDRRHAAMIEHELNVGREVGERDRLVDLVRADAEIERPPGPGEAPQIVAEDVALSLTSSGTTCRTRRNPLTNGLASWRSRKAGKPASSGRQALIAPRSRLPALSRERRRRCESRLRCRLARRRPPCGARR